MTDTLARVGRYFFSIPLIVFGVQYFVYGRFVGGLPPMPQWIPGNRCVAYLLGTALIAAGVCIAGNIRARAASLAVGIGFLLCVLVLHGPRFSGILNDGVIRTRALEPLAMAAAALALAGLLSVQAAGLARRSSFQLLIALGPYIFALCMVVFGIQHFLYAPFIATLIPAWIPGHLFFAYFTGCAFIAAGISIATRWLVHVGAVGLGLMFLSWVIVLHVPRVAAAIHNGDEWSSAFVALCMSGAAFIMVPAVQADN